MRELIREAVDTALQHKASYVDARVVCDKLESIVTQNEELGEMDSCERIGIGIRVVANGSWGFASTSDLSAEAVKRVASKAVELAMAASTVQMEPVTLADEPVHREVWKSQFVIDPFSISIDAKLNWMFKVDEVLRKDERIKKAHVFSRSWKEHQWFLNSEGSDIEQEMVWCGGGCSVSSVKDGVIQKRSYPASFGGYYSQSGYEFVDSLNILENAQRVREEAIALLTAPELPSSKKNIILRGDQLALQIHESCGHPSELDRVLGQEINFAGGSFIQPHYLGNLKYGSPLVNIVADATLPNGMATFGFDDDGVKAQKYHIVKDGTYQMYLTNREHAHRIGENRSRGCNRADGYSSIPMIRMVNISLAPGEWNWQDLLNDSDGAILFDGVKSWSIDQMRINFEFGTEVAWEIKGGKLGQIYRNPIYQGKTTEFWGSADAICNKKHWTPCGLVNCGKGQPTQIAEMTHGCSPTRFRNVVVGVKS